MRRIVLIAASALGFAAAMPTVPAVAAVPPHDHWLTTGSGTDVHVGPDVCANPTPTTHG